MLELAALWALGQQTQDGNTGPPKSLPLGSASGFADMVTLSKVPAPSPLSFQIPQTLC